MNDAVKLLKQAIRWLTYLVSRSCGRLVPLGEFFRTDKWNSHWYLKHYQYYFKPLRRKKLNLLEIGAGGYEDPQHGGKSLRMWKAFFPKAMIYSIDIYDKRALQENRIRIFQGSQADEAFLRKIAAEIGRLDIVIDDGSHDNAHVIKTFRTLFPLLAEDGIYVVEDTQTSYWPGFGGTSENLNETETIMGYFKSLTDGLNHAELLKPGFQAGYLDLWIKSIHFYHNLIFVIKGRNDEKSNVLKDNSTEEDWVRKGPKTAP